MANARTALQSRQRLDVRFDEIRLVAARLRPPVRGWIKAIREGLGMSSAQLAKRMGMKQPSVVAIEQSEIKGTIQLSTLRKVAEALNCSVVYALVPNEQLETIVRDQARKVARRRLKTVEHSMALENQAVGKIDEAVEAETRRLVRKHVTQ